MAKAKKQAKKAYKLAPDQIRELIPNLGGCIASDRITVGGAPVGSMLREVGTRPEDSGWCFFAGDETQAYMDDADNFAVYHVNTIANYDPDIIPYLYALPGQRFDRVDGAFVEAPDSDPDPSKAGLPPGVRVVQGRYQLDAWSIDLPVPFRQRIDDDNHVLWRCGLTYWIRVIEDAAGSIAERASVLRAGASPAATDVRVVELDGLLQISYRLREDSTDARVPSVYAFVVGDRGHLQLGIYLDRESDVAGAYTTLGSCTG